MNKTTGLILIAVLVVVGGGWWLASQGESEVEGTPTPSVTVSSSTTPAASGSVSPTPTSTVTPGISMAVVAQHNTSASCYTVVRGEVYDLTKWISQHPGGEQKIIAICGKDGTSAFVGQHGGAPQQENILASFKIGVLAK
jgi:hypothetical protein